MTDKLACIILDALGPYNIRKLDMEYIESLYESPEYEADLLATSGLAHTPISNPLIWGGYHNDEKIWVEQHPYRWTGGIDGFDPIMKDKEEDIRLWHRDDMETNFIWDILDREGFEPCALGVPLCLPPYYHNAENRLADAWFPHTPEMLKEHIRKKPKFIQSHAVSGYDFIACSIKVPDQWLHAQGSEIVDEEFVQEEVPVLEQEIKETIELLEAEGYDWLIFGDHGSPHQGRTANYKCKKLLARHRKEAAIIGSTETVPTYTGDLFPFMLDYFGVEEPGEVFEWKPESPQPDESSENMSVDEIMDIIEAKAR